MGWRTAVGRAFLLAGIPAFLWGLWDAAAGRGLLHQFWGWIVASGGAFAFAGALGCYKGWRVGLLAGIGASLATLGLARLLLR